jgi:hypothetical protein
MAGKEELEHGVAVMATGASPLKPDEYHYGKTRASDQPGAGPKNSSIKIPP